MTWMWWLLAAACMWAVGYGTGRSARRSVRVPPPPPPRDDFDQAQALLRAMSDKGMKMCVFYSWGREWNGAAELPTWWMAAEDDKREEAGSGRVRVRRDVRVLEHEQRC